MRIMAIESSCDETAVAVYDSAQGVLCERIASQIPMHQRFGGVVPELASREHLLKLPSMVDEVVASLSNGWSSLDALAVTAGPGLMGALLVGVSYARAAACVHQLDLIPVHHLEAHLFAPGLATELPPYPFITLLVSGGHTMLIRVNALGDYQLLGQTLDDAAGECFDKSARLMGLPYPGGPEIAALAEGGDRKRFKLPRPLWQRDDAHFSFSGLKTAIARLLHLQPELLQNDADRRDLAASIETAIVDVLLKKSLRQCAKEGVHHLFIAGGVAANRYLRQCLAQQANQKDISVYLPEPRYCTDNASMVAYLACLHRQADRVAEPSGWDAKPRWPLGSSLVA